MQTGFVLPSCNYNIVITEDELKQIIEKGYVWMNPKRIEGIFRDEHGKLHESHGHYLTYKDANAEWPVQFVTIGVVKEERRKSYEIIPYNGIIRS